MDGLEKTTKTFRHGLRLNFSLTSRHTNSSVMWFSSIFKCFPFNWLVVLNGDRS